jgi:hypothetical protein
MSTMAQTLKEVRVYISIDDHATLEVMTRALSLPSVESLATESLRFYFPLIMTLQTEADMMIQYGPDINHTQPYLPPVYTTEDKREFTQLQAIREEQWKKSAASLCSVSLNISDHAISQLRGITSNTGQFILDAMKCYFQLKNSWNSGSKIYLEKDGMIEQEIIMDTSHLPITKPSPASEDSSLLEAA